MDRKTYAQDTRTEEKFRSDFEKGKVYERLIVERLKEHFFVEYDDIEEYSDDIQDYKEDCIIWYWDEIWKIEIKFTDVNISEKWFQWKASQVQKALVDDIYALYVHKWKCAWINPKKHIKALDGEFSYCNKPVFLYKIDRWFNSFSELRDYITTYW